MIRLFANGTDITSLISDRLLGCTLSDRRSGEVDELSIDLNNHDGQLALPDPGAALQVWFPEGDSFVAMGEYQVDSVETGGPPTTVSIRATSADITDSLKTQREQSWNDTTLGAVLTEVARRNNLTPLIESTLSNRVIDHLDQTTESDLSLINRLGDDHDAVATVKSGALIFMPTGQGTTPAGTALPTATINLTDCTSWRYTKAKTTYTGVTCHYNNRAYARRDSVTVGSADNLFVIRATQRTAQAARELADAKWKKLKRAEQALELELEQLHLDAIAEAALVLVGFPEGIPATGWVVSVAEHKVGNGGNTTSVNAELIT
jgi:uncharacterized protein